MCECITGGSGYIGSVLSLELLRRGRCVKVIDIKKPLVEGIEYMRVDVRDLNALELSLKNCERIYHLAAITSIEESSVNPTITFNTNVLGTLNVLKLSKLFEVDGIIYASSASVYGEAPIIPIPEYLAASPLSVYGASKLAAEALVSSFSHENDLKAWSLRFFNVYGPSPRVDSPYMGVIHKFIKNALMDKDLVIYGDGKQIRDFVYIYDVVKLMIEIFEKVPPGVYNVGRGIPVSILNLANIIIDLTNSSSSIVFKSPRKGDIKRSVADISKIRMYGWEPKVDLVEGLRETINFYRRLLRI